MSNYFNDILADKVIDEVDSLGDFQVLNKLNDVFNIGSPVNAEDIQNPEFMEDKRNLLAEKLFDLYIEAGA